LHGLSVPGQFCTAKLRLSFRLTDLCSIYHIMITCDYNVIEEGPKMNKASTDSSLCDAIYVFEKMKGVAPRARYLMFRMVKDGLVGWAGQAWEGGVVRLASIVGYSGGAASSSLGKLVKLKYLVQGKSLTNGRPAYTYSLGPALKRPDRRRAFGEGLKSVLASEDEPLQSLSVSERCLLAQLWLMPSDSDVRKASLSKLRACAVTGVSVISLAQEVGLGKATVQKLIADLQKRSFLRASNMDAAAESHTGITKTYFLLGPSMITSGVSVCRWRVHIDGMLGWLAAGVGGLSGLVMQRYGEPTIKESTLNRLQPLEEPYLRRYILTCICAALSNVDFLSGRLDKTAIIRLVEAALLRVVKFKLTGPKARHHGIESIHPQIYEEERDLYEFIELAAGDLVDEALSIIPRILPQKTTQTGQPSYVQFSPVLDVKDCYLQLDAVFFDMCSRYKFRVSKGDLHILDWLGGAWAVEN
jgi:hypothetical protein